MTFEPTINLGHLLSLFVIVTAVFAFLWTMRAELGVLHERVKNFERLIDAVAQRLDKLNGDLRSVAIALNQLARQEERLNAIDLRIQEVTARVNVLSIPLPPKERSAKR